MDKKEAAAQKFKERTASKRFKLPEGDTTFRVLPNAKGLEKAEYIEYRMHSNVGARNAYLRCGKNIRGEGECWLCDTQIPKLEKSGKSSHRKAAELLKAKECFAVQIAYLSDGKWIGPTLWEMSSSVANKLLNVMSRRDVSNPEKGYNLTINRTGTTMRSTKYGDIDRDEEKSEVSEKILSRLKPFGEVLRKYDEDAMKTEYYGHEQEEEETEEKDSEKEEETEEEEEETPKKKKKEADEEEEEDEKPKKKKKDEEEEEETTEEEEEEKPKKKAKKKPDADEEEEEVTEEAESEEDIPDLDEEEEEKPKKKKKQDEEEEEEEEKPKKKKHDEEEEDEKPKKKKKHEDEEEEEDDKPKKKKPRPDDDDE